MGYQKYVKNAYKNLNKPEGQPLRDVLDERKKLLRKSAPIVRVERPTRIDQARKYGYKSKQGFIVAQVKIRAGGMRKSRPSRGTKPSHFAIHKITPGKSIQRIAEERSSKRYSNTEVLGSYPIFKDGKNHYFEVILVDTSHPAIKRDKDVKWVTEKQHRGRAERGLTPAGTKGRGQHRTGRGTEKNRPSIRAHRKRAK